MSHERQTIRDNVISQLVAASTAAGSRVFKSRMGPLRNAELPAICVYTLSEETDPESAKSAPRELKRTMQLAVEGWVTASDDVDDDLDDLALDIEEAMDSDLEFSEAAFSSYLASTEVGIKMDGNRPIAAVQMIYQVVYHTDLRVQAPEDTFDAVQVTYSLGNAQHDDDQAQDLVEGINQE